MISAQIINLLFLINILFLILVSPRASSSSVQDQTNEAIETVDHRTTTISPEDGSPAVRYQVFYIKNTTPFFLPREPVRSSRILIKRSPLMTKKKRKMMKMAAAMRTERNRKIKKTASTRPNFSVMLPKGFVPPSGSSPCHNGNPNSVVFFCANAKP